MKSIILILLCLGIIPAVLINCTESTKEKSVSKDSASSLVNLAHLDHLYIPVNFSNNIKAAGIYIYAEAPDYHLVDDSDEGFTCVDDVARAAQVYLRSELFFSDTSIQNKVNNLLQFIIEMQSANGYFYNFLFINTINKTGETSINRPDWWSWRALQTLTEALPSIKKTNKSLAVKMDTAINKIIIRIKTDLVPVSRTTKNVSGITVPQWLPAGSATDQAAIIILGLINYCVDNEDADLRNYIRTLADGIVMMQQGTSSEFPYSCFLSWENVWHAYGNDQAYALMKAGGFLKDSGFVRKALLEVDNFYPWLLDSGMRSSFIIVKKGTGYVAGEEKAFAQIAYGVRPMIFASLEAYELTKNEKYADMAARLTGWFFGENITGRSLYDIKTGRCFDGIIAADSLNNNAGAESTIECLLALQRMEQYPMIKLKMKNFIKEK